MTNAFRIYFKSSLESVLRYSHRNSVTLDRENILQVLVIYFSRWTERVSIEILTIL